MTTTLAPTQPRVRYHPIRGAVYGLLFGLGLALLLMVFKVLALSVPMIIVLGILFLVLGGLWGRFAPPRAAKDPPPTERAVARANLADSPNPPPPPQGPPRDAPPTGPPPGPPTA